jgi:Zn-dependent protease with chaperone function
MVSNKISKIVSIILLNKMTRQFFSVLFLLFALTSLAQTTIPKATIPEPILRNYYEHGKTRYKESFNSLNKKELKKEVQELEGFYIESNYSLSLLLRSGKILVDDTLNFTLNFVADVIKKANSIDENLHFLILRSPVQNAFCTEDGTIIVTTGLLAYLDNESELAFILCHEISHYLSQHVLNRVLEGVKLSMAEAANGVVDEKSRISKIHSYARNQETEADSLGLHLFLNTGYHPNGAITALEKLKNGHTPYAGTPFDLNFIQVEELQIDSLVKLSDDGYPTAVNDTDSVTTHPHVDDRIEFVKSKLKNVEAVGSFNLCKQVEFTSIKRLAAYSFIEELIKRNASVQALYHTYFISQKYKRHSYWHVLKAKALFDIFKLSSLSDYLFRLQIIGQSNADLQSLTSTFKNLPSICVRYLTGNLLFSEFITTNSAEIKFLCNKSFISIRKDKRAFEVYLTKRKKFSDVYKTSSDKKSSLKDPLEALKEIGIKKKLDTKLKIGDDTDENFVEDFLKKGTGKIFHVDHSKFFEKYSLTTPWVAFLDTSTFDKELFGVENIPQRPNIIILNPKHFYFSGQTSKKLRFDYKKTERKTQLLIDGINLVDSFSDKNLIQLSTQSFNETDTLNYKLYAYLNERIGKSINNDFEPLARSYDDLQLISKHNCQKVLVPVVISTDLALSQNDAGLAFVSTFFPVFFPIAVNAMIRDSGYSRFILVEYDLYYGEVEIVESSFRYNLIKSGEVNNLIYSIVNSNY